MENRNPLSSILHPSSFILRIAFEHGLPLLIYTALALLLTWPLAAHLGSAYPARPGEGAQDLWQNLWNLWWAGEALRRGVNPFFTDALFYPQGASLLFHPLNLTGGLLALPLRWLFGPVVAYNLLALLSFVLSGYVVYLLAWRHGCRHVAALAGGLIYTASAYHFFHLSLGHFEQIALHWLPLYALALDAILTTDHRPPTTDLIVNQEPRTENHPEGTQPRTGITRSPAHPFTRSPVHLVTRSLLAALVLLAVIFTSLYMALYAALLTGLWAAWVLGGAIRRRELRALLRPALGLAMALALVLAVTGPALLLPMAREARETSYMERSKEQVALGSAAPADALLPPPDHPLRALLQLPAPRSPGAFLGYLPLLLAFAGVATRPALAARWLVLALAAWLLSLGPALPFYDVLYGLPLIRAARYPDHFAILALLGVALLAALGADALLRKTTDDRRPTTDATGNQEPRAKNQEPSGGYPTENLHHPLTRSPVHLVTLSPRHFVTLSLLAALLLELRPGPTPLTAPLDNPFYHALAQEPGRFSVLELPINRANNVWVDMAAQTIHGKPILYGGLARPVPRIPVEGLPLVRALERPDAPADIVVQPMPERAAALRFFDLRYLIYHRSDENGPLMPPSAPALADVAGIPVSQVYSDERLVAYRLDLPEGPAALRPIATLGDGWYALEQAGSGAQRWMRAEGGTVQVYAPTEGQAALGLTLLSYHQPRPIDIYLDGRPVARIEAQPWQTEVSTPPFHLGAGLHTLRLVAGGSGVTPRSLGAGADDRPLTIAVFALRIETHP